MQFLLISLNMDEFSDKFQNCEFMRWTNSCNGPWLTLLVRAVQKEKYIKAPLHPLSGTHTVVFRLFINQPLWLARTCLRGLHLPLIIVSICLWKVVSLNFCRWNHAFKNQINTLQSQTKDRQNPKRPEIQSSLDLFLETASGFYIQVRSPVCISLQAKVKENRFV
jgi:hypothetical protein